MAVIACEFAVGAKLWRYGSLAKLLDLIQTKSLSLIRLDALDDRFEGKAPTALTVGPINLNSLSPFESEYTFEYDDLAQSEVYVNCWHENESESMAMWGLYAANSGVAIQADANRLLHELQRLDEQISVDRVTYHDENAPGCTYYGSPWLVKRQPFEHEREVRVVVRKSNSRGRSKIFKIPLDPKNFIHSIHCSPNTPDWERKVLERILEAYSLTIPVLPSLLREVS